MKPQRTNPPATVDRLVRENLGLVYAVAQRYFGLADHDDILAEGRVGLTIAAMRFDAEQGYAFSTYAWPWIRSQIGTFVRRARAGGVNKIPAGHREPLYHVDVDELEAAADTPTGEDVMIAEQQRACADLAIERAMGPLTARERYVAQRRLLTEDPEPLLDLAKRMGITRERVRQIQKAALGKLGKVLRARRKSDG